MADDHAPSSTASDAASPVRDWRETVFLPTTSFPMRAGLPKQEPVTLKRWEDEDLYGAIRRARQADGAPLFVLHDGPPYANGAIHIGHALNKILKDFVVRSRFALGYDVDYVPGWDCHGLPIEWKIEEQYRAKGRRKDDVPVAEFRAECRAYAAHWIDAQREEFKRLGVLGRWDAPYVTMAYATEAAIVAEFHKVLMSGRLYRGSKPVMWSPVERTALADAEVEYHDHNSPMVWVKFPVTADTGAALGADSRVGAAVVIWTTTPWTIPANRAIAYGPEIAYGLYRVQSVGEALDAAPGAKVGDRLILADSLAERVFASAHITAWTRVGPVDPSGLSCAHPLATLAPAYGFPVPLLPGEHVTDDAGTGFVHTAPGHGQEDYQVWRAFGRTDVPDTVDANGAYYDHVALFGGLQVIEADGKRAGKFGAANGAVMDRLREAGTLLASGRLEHSYPHSWRSKAPVLYRNTPQWFISLDASLDSVLQHEPENDGFDHLFSVPNTTSTLRDNALLNLEITDFFPESGKNRLRGMVETRPDWLVSRQRAWGTPLAIFVDKRTGEPLRDDAVNARIHAAVVEGGADAWFAANPAVLLGPDRDPADYERIDDILDVWFDSGCTHVFTLQDRADSRDPADLYLEGSDQARGWFQSSLLESCAVYGRAPYRAVVTHGMTLTESGEKMSKSLGNATEPQAIIRDSGAEIVRLWVATVDYAEDQRIGKTVLQTVGDGYRKLRNTVRYLLGALEGFGEAERVGYEDMPPLERWVLHRLWTLDGEVRGAYAAYRFNEVWRALSAFCAEDLSALYFDIRKDALYCDRPDSLRRRACRTVMDAAFERLTAWLAPLMPFTMEEAWGTRFPEGGPNSARVFSETAGEWENAAEGARWTAVFTVVRGVTDALEGARREKLIGSALEASPVVFVDGGVLKDGSTSDYATAFVGLSAAEVFRTSDALLYDLKDAGVMARVASGELPRDQTAPQAVEFVKVAPLLAQGDKCGRCWRILPEVTADLCLRCTDAVADRDARHG